MQKGSHHSKGPKNDLTGQQFGHLTVLKMVQIDVGIHKCWGVQCKCVCGKEDYRTHLLYALRSGTIKSCGCSPDRTAKILGSKSPSFKGHEGIARKFWYDINCRAERRGYKLELTIEEAWEVYQQQKGFCALSGLPIVFGRGDYPKETTASLDRIDSNGKYELGNVQWVHKSINIMKNVFEQEYFVNLCRRITNHMISVPVLNEEQLYEKYIAKSDYEHIAKRVNMTSQRVRDKRKVHKNDNN